MKTKIQLLSVTLCLAFAGCASAPAEKEPDYYGVLAWRTSQGVDAAPIRGFCPGRQDRLMSDTTRVSFECSTSDRVVVTFARPLAAETTNGQQEVHWHTYLESAIDIAHDSPRSYRETVEEMSAMKRDLAASGSSYKYSAARVR